MGFVTLFTYNTFESTERLQKGCELFVNTSPFAGSHTGLLFKYAAKISRAFEAERFGNHFKRGVTVFKKAFCHLDFKIVSVFDGTLAGVFPEKAAEAPAAQAARG